VSVRERDPLTGHQTTGHEWDGITELNTRVPRAVWWSIGITHAWALLVWILLPAWPLWVIYTHGLLGTDQKEQVEEEVLAANSARAGWADPVAERTVTEIRADPALMARVDQTAPALFGDNCAACHGRDAAGGPGFPSLVDDAWLWGGDPDAILETLRVGINARHPDTRVSQMPAFGRDRILDRDQIDSVIAYVKSLSGEPADPEAAAAGATVFADNCASCHGDAGTGSTELGAPDLTDAFWIYGGDDASLFDTLMYGRQGWMPSWEDRLTLTDRKILTAYLLELGQGGIR
jgi:cytochrome c oxidase cbb3-type subunit III